MPVRVVGVQEGGAVCGQEPAQPPGREEVEFAAQGHRLDGNPGFAGFFTQGRTGGADEHLRDTQ